MSKAYVYIIKNKINDKVYIGQTSKTINRRFIEHKSIARGGKEKYPAFSYIHYAIIKHGVENFYVEQLKEYDTIKQSLNGEIYYIKKYNSFGEKGYNLTRGGDKGNKGGAKLTEVEVLDIINKFINKEKTVKELANQYGIKRNTISPILHRKTWTSVKISKKQERKLKERIDECKRGENNGGAKCNKTQVIEIINKFIYNKINYKELSKLYNISYCSIALILLRKSWKNIKLSKKQEKLLKERIKENNCGENKKLSKLKKMQVLEIIDNFIKQKNNITELSKIYNISISIISGVLHRKIWKSIKLSKNKKQKLKIALKENRRKSRQAAKLTEKQVKEIRKKNIKQIIFLFKN